MNVVLGTISGSLIGFLVATVIRPPYPYFKFTIIQIGVGKTLFSYDTYPSLACLLVSLCLPCLFQVTSAMCLLFY